MHQRASLIAPIPSSEHRKLCPRCHAVHSSLPSSRRAITFQQITHRPLRCKHLHSVASFYRSWSFRKSLACRRPHTIHIVLDWINGGLCIYSQRKRERDIASINVRVYSLFTSNSCWTEGVCTQAANSCYLLCCLSENRSIQVDSYTVASSSVLVDLALLTNITGEHVMIALREC